MGLLKNENAGSIAKSIGPALLFLTVNSNLSNCQIAVKSFFSVSRSFATLRMTCEEIDDKFST